MKLHVRSLAVALTLCCLAAQCRGSSRPFLKTARSHAMKFYVSLPTGWTAHQKWPIVVTLDGANAEYKKNAVRFADERGKLPFIIVTPLIFSNVGRDVNHVADQYPKAVMRDVVRLGSSRFDHDGLLAVVREVQEEYSGAEKIFVTGWSGGGNLTWILILHDPEILAGAILACGNYLHPQIEDPPISTSPQRASLPVWYIQGGKDPLILKLAAQWEQGSSFARRHGYQNLKRDVIPNAGHSPFAREGLQFFYDLWKR